MRTIRHALDVKFAALADPTRRAIEDCLCEGPATVNELAAPFSMSVPAISRHLKVLAESGLISREWAGAYRPAELEPAALKETDNWIARYRTFWEAD